tara:strand:- start:635 stop:745 length:111 start_codon:yes stop_codon:yes gene_type:complete
LEVVEAAAEIMAEAEAEAVFFTERVIPLQQMSILLS